MNINAAIEAFSQSLGNRIEPLRTCVGDAVTADRLASEISAMQAAVLRLVREQAGDDGLPIAEIVQIARKYLSAVHPQVNEDGLQGLMRYIVWYSWHEGYLRR